LKTQPIHATLTAHSAKLLASAAQETMLGLELRKEFLVGAGGINWLESTQHGSKRDELLSYSRGTMTVVMNLSDSPQKCEAVGKLVIVSSGTVEARDGKKVIPPRSTGWFLA